MTGQSIQQEAICYHWFKQRLILSISKPSTSQRSQIKEDTVEPSVPAREFNLKVYAADTMTRPAWASNPDSPITAARQRVPRRCRQRHRGRHALNVTSQEIYINYMETTRIGREYKQNNQKLMNIQNSVQI